MTDQYGTPSAHALDGGVLRSQQVAWWPTYEFMAALLEQANVGPLPSAGTPSWCELSDGDPRKLLALAEAGVHHALRVDTAQDALAEASREIAATDDWLAVAQRVRTNRGPAYIPRRKAS